MDALGWLTLIAAPLVLSASIGLVFPRLWQRILFSGFAAAALYAVAHYLLQAEMIPQSGAAMPGHALSVRAAIVFALFTVPVGCFAGYVFHLFSRFIRTPKA